MCFTAELLQPDGAVVQPSGSLVVMCPPTLTASWHICLPLQVMDRGCVVEAGPPAELLQRQGGRFGAMMAAATGGTGAVAEKGADGA